MLKLAEEIIKGRRINREDDLSVFITQEIDLSDKTAYIGYSAFYHCCFLKKDFINITKILKNPCKFYSLNVFQNIKNKHINNQINIF